MICARSTACCGVDPARIHCSRRIISAYDNTTGKLVFDIQPSYRPNAYADSIAGHYTSLLAPTIIALWESGIDCRLQEGAFPIFSHAMKRHYS